MVKDKLSPIKKVVSFNPETGQIKINDFKTFTQENLNLNDLNDKIIAQLHPLHCFLLGQMKIEQEKKKENYFIKSIIQKQNSK